MFSKNKKNAKSGAASPAAPSAGKAPASPPAKGGQPQKPTENSNTSTTGETKVNDTTPPRPKNVTPSVLSNDLFIKGDIETSGDIQIEGRIKGNIRAHLLTVGENAVVDGEVRADDATIHGNIKGTLRGYKVRLSSSARVEGDIIHKTIAIESGAHFQGSVTRDDDPTLEGEKAKSGAAKATAGAKAEAK